MADAATSCFTSEFPVILTTRLQLSRIYYKGSSHSSSFLILLISSPLPLLAAPSQRPTSPSRIEQLESAMQPRHLASSVIQHPTISRKMCLSTISNSSHPPSVPMARRPELAAYLTWPPPMRQTVVNGCSLPTAPHRRSRSISTIPLTRASCSRTSPPLSMAASKPTRPSLRVPCSAAAPMEARSASLSMPPTRLTRAQLSPKDM